MKTQKTLIDFECDLEGCKKIARNCLDFPYGKKWVYLYNFSFKIEKGKQDTTTDKHFCSKKHLEEFILDKLKEKPKKK